MAISDADVKCGPARLGLKRLKKVKKTVAIARSLDYFVT
jgi:hypothetical protein